jgi:hypothetical protein
MKLYIALGIGLLLTIGGILWYTQMQPIVAPTTTPEENPVNEVVPEVSYMNASEDDIVVTIPTAGDVTGKQFTVKGMARGPWYFEASFPVTLLDQNGAELAQGVALAEGEWMTEEFVPFSVELTAPQSYIGPATIVLKKDNPSGEPEFDGALSIPITVEY